MIELKYQSKRPEFIRAAFLYCDYHLSNFYWNTLTALTALGTLAMMPVYWAGSHLDAYWVLLHLATITAVFGRYRLSRSLIRRNMNHSAIDQKAITLQLTDETITYDGEGDALDDNAARWDEIPMILETLNGYIIVVPRGQFIWMPFSSFDSPDTHKVIRRLFSEKGIRIEAHKEWSC
jgi:hypothetical protein